MEIEGTPRILVRPLQKDTPNIAVLFDPAANALPLAGGAIRVQHQWRLAL